MWKEIVMKNIRFGVIGVGRMGLEHAMNIRSRVPGAELAALCSQHEENARTAAEQLGWLLCGRGRDVRGR